MRVQLADSHLTYILALWGSYDVYPADGGAQLGWVERADSGWLAYSNDRGRGHTWGRTRWEAATAMWVAP